MADNTIKDARAESGALQGENTLSGLSDAMCERVVMAYDNAFAGKMEDFKDMDVKSLPLTAAQQAAAQQLPMFGGAVGALMNTQKVIPHIPVVVDGKDYMLSDVVACNAQAANNTQRAKNR